MLSVGQSPYLDCYKEEKCNEQKKKSGSPNGTWKCSMKEHVVMRQMTSAMRRNSIDMSTERGCRMRYEIRTESNEILRNGQRKMHSDTSQDI